MVQEDKLSAVLSDFARTMATDFPIQRILDHLVARIVDVLPVTAAGVTLITPGSHPRYVAASDRAALRFEKLQSRLGEGPCMAAYEARSAISAPALASDVRFPRFASAAVDAGLAAVFTFPLAHGNGCIGALDLYRDTPGRLSPRDMRAAQTLADVTVAYLLNAQAREDAKAAADVFRHNSLHDPLTGLPNRLLLQQRLEHAADRARRSHANAAVLFADLDGFKAVNDTRGHQFGDALLIAVANRLAGLVRPGDTLARFGGDEFVFLCEDLHSPVDADTLADRVKAAFREPFTVDGNELVISASVGVAFAGAGDLITDELLASADAAMYRAKRNGGVHKIIDLRDMRTTGAARDEALERDLAAALENGSLDVVYQPIVRSADRMVTGVEALLRWRDPVRRNVAAELIIATAERARLISELGQWVLERSCRDHAGWLRAQPDAKLDLSVNVSARQLVAGFPDCVEEVLARAGTDPAAVVLELTEQVMLEDSERALAVLDQLKARGVRLALDDFGTGYSSLSYLRRLPFDIVKIDKSFVADLGDGSEGRAVVAAVADLAHILGRSVTAEGIETSEQAAEIAALGCDCAQGYFYGRPTSAAGIAAIIPNARQVTPRQRSSTAAARLRAAVPVADQPGEPAQVWAPE